MDEFCGSRFWDPTLIWNTTDPDFTLCFEKTIFVWVPCAFLWIFLPLEIYHLRHSKSFDIRLNVYNVAKLAAIIAIAVLSLTDMTQYHFLVNFCSPIIKLATFILFFGLTYANMRFGRRSSAILFIFSLLLVIFGAPQFRTEFRLRWSTDTGPGNVEFFSYIIYYLIVVSLFVMNCFADSRPETIAPNLAQKSSPRNQCSFISRLLFAWFEPLVWKGYRKTLDSDDLWALDYSLSSAGNVPKFENHWKKSLRKVKKAADLEIKIKRENNRNSIDGVEFDLIENKNVSIVPAFSSCFGPTFLVWTLLKILIDIIAFASPQILSLIIEFVIDKENEEMWKGYMYAILLFLVATTQTVLSAQYDYAMYEIGLKMRTCLISIIYQKSLRVSNGARRDFTVGETVNLMSADANRFVDLLPYSYLLISFPLQVVLAIYFLWRILGISAFGGLVVMLASILINTFIASKVKSLQFQQMNKKDDRIKLMNEILSGIKVLKLYAWEASFEQQTLSIRSEEMRMVKLQEYLKVIITLIWASSSFLVYAVTFAVYVLSSDKNILDPKTAFVSVALFNILKMSFFKIPDMVSNLVQSTVSIKRINQFLNCEDLNSGDISHEKRAEALIIENGYFSWEGTRGAAILRDINVKVNHGALMAVVGPVGSGKSSLISAFLGEMYKLTGVVNTTGTVAYVPQQAWIQNATVKENITFGEPSKNFDYNRILEACALKPDLKTLSAGDMTEIGDKGVNLSGGQKQRISLARAVYKEADVYFLDDPLSAVDAHVSKHIFQHVIGPKGLLRKKTRVLVTHNVTYLSQVDIIVVIKDGMISESGSFKELLNNDGEFAEFIATYLEGDPESDEEDFDGLKEMVPLRRKSVISQIEPNVLYRRRLSVISSNGALITKRRSTIKPIPEAVIERRLSVLEQITTEKLGWHLYAYYIRPIKLLVVFIIILNILLQTLSISTNLWLVEWTNDANHSNATTSQTHFYLLIFGLLGLSKSAVEFITEMAFRMGCWASAKILHNSMLYNFFRLPLSFMDVTSGGRILSRFSKDVDVVDCIFPTHMHGVFFCLGDVICTLIIVSCGTPIFTTVVLPLGLIYFLTYRFYVATSQQLKRLESKSRSEMYSHFVETVVGAQSIRAYGLTGKFINKAEEKVDLNQRSYYPSIVSHRWLSVRTETISNMTLFFATLFAVLDRATISPGNAGLSVAYTLQLTMLLSWLVYKASEIETNMISVERIKEYSEIPQEAAWKMPDESVPKNWPSKGNINFQEFQVRYREGLELVLKNITFFIQGGQKVGIVGRTGSGKSSLALSLFRILEAAGGKILIDDIDIATIGLHTLRSKLSIIPQDPVLFAGSLRMNLDPSEMHADDRIWNVLELAHLKPFISSLQDGLQFEVSEGGENFSVGQRQLICLARALLRKTKILILDEATAAVDLETDDLIQSTIRNEFRSCTVLTIAHRLNTIMDYDKIVVLDNGYVAEYDTPKKLLQSRDSMFYRMASDAGLT